MGYVALCVVWSVRESEVFECTKFDYGVVTARFGKMATAGVLALGLVVAADPASAVVFNTFGSTENVNQNTASVEVTQGMGVLEFTIELTAPAGGNLSAVFIDLNSGGPVGSGDIVGSFYDSASFALNTNNIGNGRNLNGNFSAPINGPSGNFQFAFGFTGGIAGNGRQIAVPYTFTLDDQMGALGVGHVERIGLRFQSTSGTSPDNVGSLKLISPAPVPLPAPALLLLTGVAGLALAGRRKA